MAWIEAYRSYDGECAGAVGVWVEHDGSWRIADYLAHAKKAPYAQGALSPAALEDLQAYVAGWHKSADEHRGEWREPRFGGCCDPISMGAVRVDGVELSYASTRTAGVSVAQPLVFGLTEKLAALIPALSSHPPFSWR